MARRYNPYYVNEGRYGGVGQAIGNLGQIFADMNDPMRGAAVDRAAWSARRDREDVIDTTMARGGRETLGNIFENYSPETYSPQQVMAEAVRSNAYDPDDIGTLFQVASGNLPGMSDQQRAGAYTGTGGTIGPDDAFSLEGANDIAMRNAGFDQDLQQIKEQGDYRTAIDVQALKDRNDPMSRDQLLASLFMSEGPEAATEAQAALYGRGSGGRSGDPWMEAKRRSDIEADVFNTIDTIVTDMGLDPSTVPPELRQQVAEEALAQVRNSEASPRAAAMAAFQARNPRAEGLGWLFDGSPRLEYDETPAPRQPDLAGEREGYPVVASDADFDKLPSGTEFIDAETGKRYIKP